MTKTVWPSLLVRVGFLLGGALSGYGFGLLPTSGITPQANLASTKPVNSEDLQLSIQSTEIRRSADGLFHLQAKVNGTSIRFIVDSGASIVVLTARDAAKLGLKNSTAKAHVIHTAGGLSSMTLTRLESFDVAGQTLSQVNAAVMREGLQTSLLGQNILTQLGAVTQEGDVLRIKMPQG